MPIRQATPEQAYEELQSNPDAIYLDVRTPEEFAAGHPEGAWNIPVVFFDPAGGPAQANEDFVAVVQEHLSSETHLVVGCLSGGRSQRACTILESAGYAKLVNVQGGFGGARDRAGQVVVAGWRDVGLPVAEGHPPGRSYGHLTGKE